MQGDEDCIASITKIFQLCKKFKYTVLTGIGSKHCERVNYNDSFPYAFKMSCQKMQSSFHLIGGPFNTFKMNRKDSKITPTIKIRDIKTQTFHLPQHTFDGILGCIICYFMKLIQSSIGHLLAKNALSSIVFTFNEHKRT